MAGTLAPDLGFFPGGPAGFSTRLHRERSGDFLCALQETATGDLEKALVAGWALHLWADLLIHPLVEAWVGRRLGAPAGRRIGPQLWHKRLEWGLDCLLLGQPGLAFLWGIPLCFPGRSGGPGLLSLVGREFCGEEAGEAQVQRGIRSLTRWIGRLPWIFLWSGHLRPEGRRFALGPWVRPLVELLGTALAPFPRWLDAAAVARPVRPAGPEAEQAFQQAEEVLRRFQESLNKRFAGFPNADLDSGNPPE